MEELNQDEVAEMTRIVQLHELFSLHEPLDLRWETWTAWKCICEDLFSAAVCENSL